MMIDGRRCHSTAHLAGRISHDTSIYGLTMRIVPHEISFDEILARYSSIFIGLESVREIRAAAAQAFRHN